MRVSGLVPARFLTIIAHLIIVIVIFFTRDENVKMCLPEKYTTDEFTTKDNELIIGLSVSLGLFAFELLSFFAGVSMFMPFQSLLSTVVHCIAAIALSYFLFDGWPCDYYWIVFAFCSALPTITELVTIIGVVCLRKGIW